MANLKQNKDMKPEEIARMTSAFLGKKNAEIKPYEDLNKIPYYLMEYRSSAMPVLKAKFMEQVELARKNEKAFCEATGGTPTMQGLLYTEVVNLVDRCKDFFELEAAARFIFDDNEIPSYSQITLRAQLLENALGWNLKK